MASGGKSKFSWTDKTLFKNLADLSDDIDAKLWRAVQHHAARAEGNARRGAKWTDQTGNARQGLRATAFRVPKETYGFTLSHSVPYGVYLETRWSGKFGIIRDTLNSEGPELMATIKQAIP